MIKKKFYRYSGPFLCAALTCFGLPFGAMAAEETAAETAKYIDIAEYYTDMNIEESLLRLRIRYGEEFVFPMEISGAKPAADGGTGQNKTAHEKDFTLLRGPKDYRELRSCPLPIPAKTIGQLENLLTRMTENYSGQWSVYVKNLTTGDTFIINDTPMRSASVMKLFIMGTVYEALEQRTLERTQEITALLTAMICDSSNSASNQLLSILGDGIYANGIAKVNDYISRQGYSARTYEYNGFEDAAAICDSKHFNQVTAADCGELLERIYRRTFASRRVCNEAENLMLNQNTRYKIPKGLPEGVAVGNKTGEMDTVENDAAIVYGDYSDYILCVLSGEWDSKDAAITNIQEISSTVYRFFNDPSYYRMSEPNSYELLAGLLARKSDTAVTSSVSDSYEAGNSAEAVSENGTESEIPETALFEIQDAFPFLNLEETTGLAEVIAESETDAAADAETEFKIKFRTESEAETDINTKFMYGGSDK